MKIEHSSTIKVHHTTIWRFQRQEGQKPYKSQKQTLLTARNIEARKQFVAKYGSKPETFWDNWLFTDEKYFGLSECSNSKNDVIWTNSPNKVLPVGKPKNDAKIMVWGGMSSQGLTPLIVFKQNEKLTAAKYLRKILVPMIKNVKSRKSSINDLTRTKLFSNVDSWILQQDGATSHTANNVQNWLSKNVKKFIPKEEWPGNSPDLNPIENLWAIMESKLYDNGHFGTIDELIEKIQHVWKNIPLSTLQSLSRSMKQRLEYVKENPDRKAPY
jgi:hypothetical protein